MARVSPCRTAESRVRQPAAHRGTTVAPLVGMDCFFGTFELPRPDDRGKNAIVTFSIPELGIRFKAPFRGVNRHHCDLASLLALLEFIDSNQKYFTDRTYQIFGNNPTIINQVNGREPFPPEFTPLMERAARYRRKYRFSLEWIPTADNAAFDRLSD